MKQHLSLETKSCSVTN